jgi:hypothetical protein
MAARIVVTRSWAETPVVAPSRASIESEGRAVAAAVFARHRRQLQAADLVGRQAQADDAAAFADHQGHGFIGELVGGDDQVRFVLAVEVVEQDDGDTRPGRGQCCCNAAVQVRTVESVSID